MYFYKYFDENGNVVRLETKKEKALNLPLNTIELSESDYQGLMEEMLADMEESCV